MPRKIPFVIAGTACLSGVTTWAERLRDQMRGHDRYDVKLLYIGRKPPEDYELSARHVGEAADLIRSMAPVIVAPNYLWDLYMTGFHPGVLCVGMCHADDDEQYYRPLSWYEPVIRHFVAVSRECQERVVARLPYRSQDVTMLPYGIHVPCGLSRDYQADPLRIIYAGRVTQLQKRVRDFVPLVEELGRLGVRYTFDIVGDGDELAHLRKELLGRAPRDAVRFHGHVPHSRVPEFWAAADAFVQVSDFEGTSVSMLEAMANGVAPVVTAASSGIRGVVNDGENGFVVPVGDMAGMARALQRLSRDKALLARLAGAAHVTAQAYSADLYPGRFAEVLDRVTGAPPAVDIWSRYGMFAGSHPTFIQQRMINELRSRLGEAPPQGPWGRWASRLFKGRRAA